MVNEPKQTSDNVRTLNKGVNITSDTFPLQEENPSEATNDFPSLHNVRNQLQNVIDVMETNSPNLIYTSSMNDDADNEESVISSTSIFSSVLQVKHINKNVCQSISTFNSPREVSEISDMLETDTCAMVNELPREKQPQPICVPAVLPPAVLCMNPSCLCTHSFGYMQQLPNPAHHGENVKVHKEKPAKKNVLSDFIGKLKHSTKENGNLPNELYKMNVLQTNHNGSPPRRFVFDLVEGVSKPEVITVGTNTRSYINATSNTKNVCINEQLNVCSKNSAGANKGITMKHSHYSGMVHTSNVPEEKHKFQHATYYRNLEEKHKLQYRADKDTTKVDVYYFDHGNAAYYRTTDSPPLILTELLAEKAETYATKFWAQLFGTIYIGFAFFTSFILQFSRFILYSIVRPLTIGILQLISDYFFKPFLAALFNAVIQPPLIFLYNIFTSIRDLCDPLAEGCGYFLREIAVICRSIRLFEIKQEKQVKCKNQTETH